MIKDVVQRVKCELSDAFDRKTDDPKFLWLANWTVKADLTLIINDSAGITPTGSFTKIHRSAINSDAGPTTPGGKTLGLVPQLFTFGAGANLSAQAVRTETLSFTLALDELKLWRGRIEREESSPSFPPEKRTCRPKGIGVTGNLGLKEWVDSAFFPVEARELEAGIHPAPLTQKASSVPAKASSPPPTGGLKAEEVLTYGIIQARLSAWRKQLQDKLNTIERADAEVKAASQKITSSQSSLDTKISQMKIDAPKYRYVLVEYLKKRIKLISAYKDLMWSYVRNAALCTKRLSDIVGTTAKPGTVSAMERALKDIDSLSEKINAEISNGAKKSDQPKPCTTIWIDYFNVVNPFVVKG